MYVVVPHIEAGRLMGGVPVGIELAFWAGDDALPENVDMAEVFVPPWWAKGRAVAAMRKMPRLRLVQLLGAGYDWIVPGLPSGVLLANSAGVNARPVAEWVLAAILAVVRDMLGFHADQVNRTWHQRGTGELGGSRVLVIGHGAVGQRVTNLLRSFEAEVAVVASSERIGVSGPGQIPDLLRWADIVVVVVPLSATTRHMVDTSFLANMRDGAVLVNAARGEVVATEALVAELKAGRLRAALDVTDPEPLPPEHELWSLPGLLVTPHVASVVPSFLPNSYSGVRSQLVRILNGEPPENVVAGAGRTTM